MAATLLIYHMEDDRRQILENLCRSMDIKPVHVDKGSHRAPICILSGHADMKALSANASASDQMTESGPIGEEMIVMCGFTKTQFDILLDALKMAGLRIGLKAVETPTNMFWNGEMLHNELAREREAFRQRK